MVSILFLSQKQENILSSPIITLQETNLIKIPHHPNAGYTHVNFSKTYSCDTKKLLQHEFYFIQ